MSAFDNHKKHKKMPSDANKTTLELIAEIKDGLFGNQTALIAKCDEMLNNRVIDDNDTGVEPEGKGGVRPTRAPIV